MFRKLFIAVNLILTCIIAAEWKLDIPPRYQWNANNGYCGEVSFISVGLYYGQYCSQWIARQIASPGVKQNDYDSQLLVGVNDEKAAAGMRLKATAWDFKSQTTTKQYLSWVKKEIIAGHPVVGGVFVNEYLVEGDTDPMAGNEEYDHVIPIIGISAASASKYNNKDKIIFSDNGLYGDDQESAQYIFSYDFGSFPTNRKKANNRKGPVYSLSNSGTNYGISFSGVMDLNGDTVPVRLTTSVNQELPIMKDGQSLAPMPNSLTLTAQVTIPDQKVDYCLYLYKDFAKVPVSNFNAQAKNAFKKWDIRANQGPIFEVSIEIMSNEIAAFRAVRKSAP